ncbi:hypothetical protein [Actinomadura atramentaria]|uniref:hypothetical protein n=1 Tax=Actinomadura atramentaria TaxID=1990 RepID=UPI00037A1D5C|nr:hypothetical protein [Actinomadura atramentaria]
MPRTRGAGRLFFHTCPLSDQAPLIHRAPSWEVDYPFRAGRSIIVRWRGRGLVFGYWKTPLDEDAALTRAIDAHQAEMFDRDGALLPHFTKEPAHE